VGDTSECDEENGEGEYREDDRLEGRIGLQPDRFSRLIVPFASGEL
jgi:hypothetical protein